jgi:hypothetical protein
VKQAETQKTAADSVVNARIPETYQWLITPTQTDPQVPISWQTLRLSGAEALADRASKKLKNDEFLVTTLAATRLRMELDRVPLWRGDSVPIRQLVEDFGRYLYLPRLRSSAVLLDAIRSGLALLTWEKDAFAYAESYDDQAGRYRGMRHGTITPITADDSGLLVKPDIARRQIDEELKPTTAEPATPAPSPADPATPTGNPQQARPKRYHGTVKLDAARVGRDASRIADEVISHLVGLVGTNVSVTLEIDAQIPTGAPDNVVRTVTENGRTLKFQGNSGFESH